MGKTESLMIWMSPPPPFGSIVSIRSFNTINKLLTAITIIKSQRQDLVWSNDFQQFETTGISGNLCIVDVHIWTIIFKTYCRDYDTFITVLFIVNATSLTKMARASVPQKHKSWQVKNGWFVTEMLCSIKHALRNLPI